MPTSREHIQACFAKLRSLGLQPPRMAADGYELMLAAWAEKLGRYDPRAVKAAFDRWADEREDWPVPKHLLPLVDAQQARLEKQLEAPRAQDTAADLNAALERVMREMPGLFLVELYELGQSDPDLKRRVVNRLAEWELSGATADDAAALARAMMRGPVEAVA